MISVNNRLQKLFYKPGSIYTRPLVRRSLLFLVFFALYMVCLSADFIPEKVSLLEGEVSDRDVIAPRTVSYVDTAKTKKLEMEVLASVANVYDMDVAVMAKAEEDVKAIFRAAQSTLADNTLTSNEQKLQKLTQGLPVSLSSTVVNGLINLDKDGLAKAEDYTTSILRKYLQRGIRDDDLEIARKQVVLEVEELGLDKNTEAIVAGIAQTLIRPNFILNVRETDKRKQTALANIEPVRETVKKGQILVRRGDVVTSEQIHVMVELGLYAGNVSEVRIFGLAVFVLLIMGITIGYLYQFAKNIQTNDRYLILLGLIVLITMIIAKVAHYYSDFTAPVAAGALLTAILIDARVALLISVVMAMFFGVIVEHDLRAVTAALFAGMTGVYSVTKMVHGYNLTKAGIAIAAVNFLVIGSTGLIEQLNGKEILMQGLLGAVGGIVSAVITIGLSPYLENVFNITTPIKLLDLAKPNHPLLQRLLLEAPGTYHHSVIVGNLAETAAVTVGADPVVVRVGAYYHDIGKTKRPFFFIENQPGSENPHDKLAPSLSTLIITSHVKDGVDLCQDYKLPQIITDIVQQHHGTTLVSYFYKRATEHEHGGESVIEEDFRYEGPTPQTKEAALIMLADACEAAVRSISKPTVNRIESTVRKIIRERLQDGQLDDCNLTLKDLNIIGDVYIRLLSSMFHNRIEYPEALKELERRKNKNGNNIKQLAGKDDDNPGNGAQADSSSK